MHVEWFRHFWVSFASNHPSTVVVLVSTIIGWYNVHEKEIFRPRIEACHARFNRRKHAPVERETRSLDTDRLKSTWVMKSTTVLVHRVNNFTPNRSECVRGGIVELFCRDCLFNLAFASLPDL